jgi:YD repeat-containing protein
MEIYNPSGARIGSATTETSPRVPADGTYLIAVVPGTTAGETGAYSVALQRPNNPCNAASLACGQSLLRSIDVPGQIDAVVFDGVAAEPTTIRIPSRSGALAPFAELYNENGTLMRGISTGSVTMAFPSAGKYTLLIRDRNGPALGSYRVSLQRDPACPVDDKEAPSISLDRPTGGEVIAGGTLFHIGWRSDDNVDVASHEVRLSTDGGTTFPTVVGGNLGGATQSFDWAVPQGIAPTRTAVVQVTATDTAGNTRSATSDLLAVIGSGFGENSSARFTYDELNRVVEAAYSDGRTVTYTYDSSGNVVRVAVTQR